MDLKALMNSNDAATNDSPKTRRISPEASKYGQAQFAHRSSSGAYGTPPMQQQNFPRPVLSPYGQHPPPPPLFERPSFERPMSSASIPQATPQRTPSSVASGGSQYPFPNNYQSPVESELRTQDRFSAITPGARQYAHPYQPVQVSPSSYAPPPPLGLPNSASHSNASATPPSLHAHSPRGPLESPLPGASLAHPAYNYGQHHTSQPSTPLGPPPPLQYQRSTSHMSREGPSPYPPTGRNLSGTSIGAGRSITSGSPAQSSAALGHLLESPAGYGPSEQCQKRRSTDYSIKEERDRSMSVSPKTMVRQRQPSDLSRHSSLAQDSQTPNISHIVSSEPAALFARPQLSIEPTRSSEVSQPDISPARGPKLYSGEQKSIAPQPMAVDTMHTRENSAPEKKSFGYEAQGLYHLQQPLNLEHSQSQKPPLAQTQMHPPTTAEVSNKRPAADELPSASMAKRARQRKYVEPPIWARRAPTNPHFRGPVTGQHIPQRAIPIQQQTNHPSPRSVSGVPPVTQPNGHTPQLANGLHERTKHAGAERSTISALLDMSWESSITDTKPRDELVRQVADFLYLTMLRRENIGTGDATRGALEVEAKFGTLIDRNTSERLALPVMTKTVLHQDFSDRNIRFESQMSEAQHRQMNLYLNKLTEASQPPHRTSMEYKHRYEQDSSAALSKAGLAALPPACREVINPKHTTRLRTTFNVDPKLNASKPPIIARIVKIRLADLDIYMPEADFDVRLSVNIEVDMLNRRDIDQTLLAVAPEEEPSRNPDRHKNRMSYTHLAYSIDLTQVTSVDKGKEKTHELEIEVDATRLREQAMLLKDGRANAYGSLVEVLVDNCIMLMKYKE